MPPTPSPSATHQPALTHRPGCPVVHPDGGAKGPCLCGLGRPANAPAFSETVRRQGALASVSSGERARRRDEVIAMRAELAEAKKRHPEASIQWYAIRRWAIDTGRFRPSELAGYARPAVDAYLRHPAAGAEQ